MPNLSGEKQNRKSSMPNKRFPKDDRLFVPIPSAVSSRKLPTQTGCFPKLFGLRKKNEGHTCPSKNFQHIANFSGEKIVLNLKCIFLCDPNIV